MTVINAVPKVRFQQTSATRPRLSNAFKTAVFAGCSDDAVAGPLLSPEIYNSGSRVRTIFGECGFTRMAENHFAMDPDRTPVIVVRVPTTTAGVLHLDTSDFVGSSAITVNSGVTPLGDYQPYVEVVTGGARGTAGIILYSSLDGGRKKTRIELGTAVSLDLGYGVKIDFGAGTITSGTITGYTEPPKWTSTDLYGNDPSLFKALKDSGLQFGMVDIVEPATVAEAAVVASGQNSILESTPTLAVLTYRKRYQPSVTATITATFANANPDTLARSAGSFITDGFKVGMRVTITGAIASGDNGTFVRVATVGSTLLTFTSNVTFTAEVATAGVAVSGQETEADYDANLASETSAVANDRLVFTVDEVRAATPNGGYTLDQTVNMGLASTIIINGLSVDAGQVTAQGAVGGPFMAALNGAIYDGPVKLHYDANADDALPIARFTVLRRQQDLRPGAYVNRGLTMAGVSSQVDTIVKALLRDEWLRIVLSALIDKLLLGEFADPSNPNLLSEEAVQDIESYVLAGLRTRFTGLISNVEPISQATPKLFAVDPASDLSSGYIDCEGTIVTKAYPEGFKVQFSILQPGQVG